MELRNQKTDSGGNYLINTVSLYVLYLLWFIVKSGNSDNEEELSGKLLGNRPIPIVVATEEHAFELDEEALAKVLLNDNIKDKKVAVISVAGAFRKGKSFLLDFFLRYLDRKVRAVLFFYRLYTDFVQLQNFINKLFFLFFAFPTKY